MLNLTHAEKAVIDAARRKAAERVIHDPSYVEKMDADTIAALTRYRLEERARKASAPLNYDMGLFGASGLHVLLPGTVRPDGVLVQAGVEIDLTEEQRGALKVLKRQVSRPATRVPAELRPIVLDLIERRVLAVVDAEDGIGLRTDLAVTAHGYPEGLSFLSLLRGGWDVKVRSQRGRIIHLGGFTGRWWSITKDYGLDGGHRFTNSSALLLGIVERIVAEMQDHPRGGRQYVSRYLKLSDERRAAITLGEFIADLYAREGIPATVFEDDLDGVIAVDWANPADQG